MSEIKFEPIKTAEALVELQKQFDYITMERQTCLVSFKEGNLSCDYKIASMSKQLKNLEAIINDISKFSYFRRGKYIYAYIPMDIEEHSPQWDNEQGLWVISEPKCYKSNGYQKPCIIPSDAPFVSSNFYEVQSQVAELNINNVSPTTCKECGTVFGVLPGEATFYKKSHLALPKRCPACRYARKKARESIEAHK